MASIKSWRGQATQVCRERQQSSLGKRVKQSSLGKRVKQSSLGKRVKQSSLGQDGQAIKSWQRESSNQVLAERVEQQEIKSWRGQAIKGVCQFDGINQVLARSSN
jgi:hypothetical protein